MSVATDMSAVSDKGGRALLTIILAAGKGTRMKSSLPKVLQPVGGRSMLGHVMTTACAAGAGRIAVVVGPDMETVADAARSHFPAAEIFLQADQNGTADAVLAARDAIASHTGDVMVLLSDVPLVRTETLAAMRASLDERADISVLGFRTANPHGYGRLVLDSVGDLVAIREQNDASEAERSIDLCNSGVMAFRSDNLLSMLDAIGNANSKQEFYLTDIVEVGRAQGRRAIVVEGRESEILGINDKVQLAAGEMLFQQAARERVMLAGTTLIAPETVNFSYDTVIGRDVVIEPNVVFGPGVVVEDGARIKSFSHLEGAKVGPKAQVGPYARLRPGAQLGEGARVGNFVEIKQAKLETGAKVNHLTYIGDARVGAGANVGAGTITCNYDGFRKHHTDIGAGAFIGSNSSLVAPVRIGDGAYIGSGSVIGRDVEPDALALTRAPLEQRPGWAARFRSMMSRKDKAG